MVAARMLGFFGLLWIAVAGVLFVGCGPSDREIVNHATDLLLDDKTGSASLLLLEVRRPEEVVGGLALLNQALEAQLDHPESLPEGERGKGAELVTLAGHLATINDVSFNQKGSLVVTASADETAIVWDAATGKVLLKLIGHKGEIYTARFSPDDQRVLTASADQTARIWNIQQGQEERILSGHTNFVRAANYSRDGEWVVTASTDGTARIWDIVTGEDVYIFDDHSKSVTKAILNLRKTRLLTVSRDQKARLFSVRGGGTMLAEEKSHEYEILPETAMFRPEVSQESLPNDDSTWVLTAFDDEARIWGDAPRESFKYLNHGNDNKIQAAGFSHDGELVVTASEDRTVWVWEVTTGDKAWPLDGHQKAVTAVAFSPDKKWIVTASGDGKMYVWDTERRHEVAVFGGSGGAVTGVTFNESGDKILTRSEDNIVRIWLWKTPAEVAEYLQARIRIRTSGCLSDMERRDILKEYPAKAMAAREACESCTLRFFEELGSVQSHQWESYVKVWRTYKNCTLK